MYSNAKNTANYLAKSETLRNIALPKPRIASYISTYSLIWAYSPLHFCARSCEVLANLRGVRSLFVHTKLVFNKCQNLTRVAIPRITVTGLHPLYLPQNTIGGAFGRRTSIGLSFPRSRKSTWSTSTDRSLATTSNSRATTFLSRSSMMKSIRRSLSAMPSSSSCTNIREGISITLRPISA